MRITRISIDNPVFTVMVMLALVVFGLFSYRQLATEELPDVEFPVVMIVTDYPGASPEAVESEVSRPIEHAVNSIAGIEDLASYSFEGKSIVVIKFDLAIKPEIAVQAASEKINAIQNRFRSEIKRPLISRFDPNSSFPTLSIAVTSRIRDLRALTVLSDQVILKRLENINGVGQASLVGGVKRQINIHIDPARLESLSLSVEEILQAIGAENQDIPSGTISHGARDKVIEVRARVRSPAEFKDLIVARRDGAAVRLGDIAKIEDGQEIQETLALHNGKPTLVIDIFKVQKSNEIELVDDLTKALKDLTSSSALPADVELSVVRDKTTAIRNSVRSTRNTLIEGATLTIAIVFLFLNSWRSTIITGLTLPVSVIGSFTVLKVFGFTLNNMTLMALSLVIGILIDDAIVVRENISRHLRMGKSHRRAALEGTTELGLPVTATTLAIVAVFLPVAFMGGIVGRFFWQFGITISAAVLISLFVSFTLDPMLSSLWYDPAAHGKHGQDPLSRAIVRFDRGFEAFGRLYSRILAWSLRHRRIVLSLACAIFIASFALVKPIGVDFAPAPDLSQVAVLIETPVGSSLDYSHAKLRLAEETIRRFEEVTETYAEINAPPAIGKDRAILYVTLVGPNQRRDGADRIVKRFRAALSALPGISTTVFVPNIGGGAQKQIQLSLQGPDIEELDRLSQEAIEKMSAVPGMVDIGRSLKATKPTLAVRLDREIAGDLGIGARQVAASLRPLFAGERTASWQDARGESYDVQVRLPPAARRGAEDLSGIALPVGARAEDGSPQMIPLLQIATLSDELGSSQINRRAMTREVLIGGNPEDRPLGDVGNDVQEAISSIALPPGYRFVAVGAIRDLQETVGYALQALLLAIILIYLILASQFGSLLQPLAIMISLPLSLVGVLLGLFIAGSTLNVFSIIGFITLMGLVTKNAILLVDFANQAQARGASLADALLEAGQVRLRPIIMTSMAMTFGMLPLGLGLAGKQSAPMAHAVIGGLISSTLLTLVVAPVLLIYLDRLSRWGKRFFASAKAPQEE